MIVFNKYTKRNPTVRLDDTIILILVGYSPVQDLIPNGLKAVFQFNPDFTVVRIAGISVRTVFNTKDNIPPGLGVHLQGGDCCDFRFVKHRRGEVWGRTKSI